MSKKGQKQRKYSPEFKASVIMDMREHRLSYCEDELKRYIDYYNNERISIKLKGMSPVQYRTHSQAS